VSCIVYGKPGVSKPEAPIELGPSWRSCQMCAVTDTNCVVVRNASVGLWVYVAFRQEFELLSVVSTR
jgi:hypothetical protein